jgi:MFS family permease
MTHRYRECLSSPHAVHLFAANLLGRLPTGMTPLAIAIILRSHHVAFGTVGAITAAYGLAASAGGPLLSRLVDRFGQTAVLAVGALLSAAGLIGAAAAAGGSPALIAAAVVVAGFFNPPLEACLRSLWPTVLPSQEAVFAAYALDASLQEVVFAVGPLLVVGITAAVSAGATLPVTAAALLVGTASYLRPAPVRRWRAEPRQADWAGPLRSAVIRRLLASMACVGVSLGALGIVAVAYQEHDRYSTLSGIVLGLNAVGALAGGLAYGARQRRTGPERQLLLMQAAAAVCYLPLVIVPPVPVVLLCVLCAGLFLSPVLTCAFTVIGGAAPRGTATEAFAWLVTSIGLGIAAGSSLAGLVVGHFGLGPAGLVLACAFLAAAVLALRITGPAAADPRPAPVVPAPNAEVGER